MCFTAGASFSAAAVLTIVGAVSLSKATNSNQKMFAALPLIFALQQFCEGILWLSFTQESFIPFEKMATYSFLFFAQIFWPTFVPLSILLLEKDVKRRKWLKFATIIGALGSAIMLYRILSFSVFAEVREHHIYYEVNPSLVLMIDSSICYFIATVIPCFLSSVKYMKLLGSLLFASLVLTKLFATLYFISVWCFFAALISCLVLYIIIKIKVVDKSNTSLAH